MAWSPPRALVSEDAALLATFDAIATPAGRRRALARVNGMQSQSR